MSQDDSLATLGVRAGQQRSQFNEHAEALYLTSSFVFESAAQAAARFTGGEDGYVYSRFTNPTVTMLQERLAALEGAECCLATASGMSAILMTAMSLLEAGDHVVCSSAVFGSTVTLFGTILSRFGVETTFVPPTEVAAWRTALRPGRTRLLFLETPSNPLIEIADIAAIAAVAHGADALLAVDNCFCTPALQLARWLELHPNVARVFHPGLDSHPQRELAARQQRAGGAIVSFEVRGGRDAAWKVVDGTRLISITGNLGDVKTTITHPATTTHGRISPEARAAAGITEGLLRVAVGLEAVEDLQADLARGLG